MHKLATACIYCFTLNALIVFVTNGRQFWVWGVYIVMLLGAAFGESVIIWTLYCGILFPAVHVALYAMLAFLQIP